MEEDTKIEDVINKESRFETLALAEIGILDVNQGDVIQLERRGYFYVDQLATQDQPMHLHFVPDGKTKNQSNIETKINVKTLAKGDNEDGKKKKQEKKQKEPKEKKRRQYAFFHLFLFFSFLSLLMFLLYAPTEAMQLEHIF